MARKRYQQGSLHKRVGKHKSAWVAQWREDVVENGQVLRRFRKESWPVEEFPTRKLAQRELERRLSSINSPDYRPTHKMLFADFAQRWIDTVLPMHKPSSRSSEKAHLARYISPFFGQFYLHDIAPFHVQRFVSTLTDVAPKTVRNIYATFRAMWKLAKQWGLVQTNACESIRMPQLRPVERPAFTIEQMQQIVQTAEGHVKTFFWLASETGMRIGELCGIRWEDLDLDKGIVRVRQSVWNGQTGTPKSAAGVRECYISEELADRFTDAKSKERDSAPFVFHTRTGQAWDTRFIVRDNLQPILRQLGIPFKSGTGVHAFRHGCATWRIQNGEDVKTLATQLGHSDPSITLKVYAHAVQSRTLSSKMGQMLSKVMPSDAKVLPVPPQFVVPEGVIASA